MRFAAPRLLILVLGQFFWFHIACADPGELPPGMAAGGAPVTPPSSATREKAAVVRARVTQPICATASQLKLVWHDEFNDLSLDDTFPTTARWLGHFGKWNVRYLSANGDDGIKLVDNSVLQSGETVADALRPTWPDRGGFLHQVSNGTLKLRAYPVPDALTSAFWDHHFVASMISGEPSFAQRYGYWETRLRLNSIGKGQHFTLWLLASDGSWPPEIDIVEVVGNNPHLFSANVNNAPMDFYGEPTTPDGFHVFGLLLTSTTIRWTIDGKVVREIADTMIGNKALYLLATWEIGSIRPEEMPDASTPWPAEAEIDYVRIYSPP